MSVGKVGIKIERKFTDGDYGSYTFGYWAEEEYLDDKDRQTVAVKLLKEGKTIIAAEKAKIEFNNLSKGKQNA